MFTFFFLMFLLVAPGAQSQNVLDLPPGSKITKWSVLGTVQIPLPEGEWVVVSAVSDSGGREGGGLPITIGRTFLVQKHSGDHTAWIYARTNLGSPSCKGWRRPKALCDRSNIHYDQSDRNFNSQDADCWQVNHLVNTNKVRRVDFENEMKSYIRKNFDTSTFVSNSYWKNDACHFMHVMYNFSPVPYGFQPLREDSWRQSDWHRNEVDSAEKKFIESVRALGVKLHAAVQTGFRKGLHDVPYLFLEFSQ